MDGWTKISLDAQEHLTELSELVSTVGAQLRIVRSQHETLRSQLSQFENEWIEHAMRTSSSVIEYQDPLPSPTPESSSGRRWRIDPLRLRRWSRDPDESVGTAAWFNRLTLASQSLGSSMAMMSTRVSAHPSIYSWQDDAWAGEARSRDHAPSDHIGEVVRRMRALKEIISDLDGDFSTQGYVNRASNGKADEEHARQAGHRHIENRQMGVGQCTQCRGSLSVAVEETDQWLSTIKRALSLAASNSQKSTSTQSSAALTRSRHSEGTLDSTIPQSLQAARPKPTNDLFTRPPYPDNMSPGSQENLREYLKRRPMQDRGTSSSLSDTSLTTLGTPSVISSTFGPGVESQSTPRTRCCPVCNEQEHPTSDVCRGADKEAVTPNLEPTQSSTYLSSHHMQSQSSISLPDPAPTATNATFDRILEVGEHRRSPSISGMNVGSPMPEVHRKSRGREALERRMRGEG